MECRTLRGVLPSVVACVLVACTGDNPAFADTEGGTEGGTSGGSTTSTTAGPTTSSTTDVSTSTTSSGASTSTPDATGDTGGEVMPMCLDVRPKPYVNLAGYAPPAQCDGKVEIFALLEHTNAGWTAAPCPLDPFCETCGDAIALETSPSIEFLDWSVGTSLCTQLVWQFNAQNDAANCTFESFAVYAETETLYTLSTTFGGTETPIETAQGPVVDACDCTPAPDQRCCDEQPGVHAIAFSEAGGGEVLVSLSESDAPTSVAIEPDMWRIGVVQSYETDDCDRGGVYSYYLFRQGQPL